jgi:PPOX class probable F420-dependent enzyme
MSLDPISAELFGGGHVVHLATLRPDGAPQSRPLWTIVHEGRVVFFTQATSPKARDVERDPRVALSVTDKHNPYRSAWLRGRVARVIEGDDALEVIDLISDAYIGRPFPMRSGSVFVIEPEAQGSADLPFEDK